MGKKYFCDYCQKHIQINPAIIKRHNEGIPHLRNKMAHYEKFKDPAVIVSEEVRKLPCRTLVTSSECTYGASCRYSHYRPEQLSQLSQQVTWTEQQKMRRQTETTTKLQRAPEIVQSFLERRSTTQAKEATEYKPFWSFSEDQLGVDVPPSLQEIDPSRLGRDEVFPEWG